jgi:twitching motility protein PilT
MSAGQQVLAKLLVGNGLLNEKQCVKLFQQAPDPEDALAKLVKAGHVSDRVGVQVLEMYRQKMAKLAETPAGNGDAPAATEKPESPAAKPAAAKTAEAPAEPKKAPATAKVLTSRPDVAADAKGKQLIHAILKKARELGASDVHIAPGLSPILRYHAKLTEMEMPPLSPEDAHGALIALLDPERRAIFEEHHDLDFCYDGGEELGRFRTNYLREQNGTGGTFRLISSVVPVLDDLGMPATVEKFTTYAVGIVLITGPKSCGKTTTLAAMVDLINRTRADHVITIEDPIEFVHPCKKGHISQREVGTHTKSFGNALRAALREAPQVIMVGEMRDLETTSLAVSAAETGHLVLATLHTPDAIRTIGRVLDVFPPKEQGQIRAMLSESLRGVVSQQLVPSKDGKAMHLALEILVNTSAIGNMIREERAFQIRGAMQTGRKLGMVLLDDSLLRLVAEDKIEPQEAVARASDPDYVMKELSRPPAKK